MKRIKTFKPETIAFHKERLLEQIAMLQQMKESETDRNRKLAVYDDGIIYPSSATRDRGIMRKCWSTRHIKTHYVYDIAESVSKIKKHIQLLESKIKFMELGIIRDLENGE